MAIVHGWDGNLELDTAPGAGTRVSIVLPVIEGQSVVGSAIADRQLDKT